jgi:hypothetical protein
VPEKDVNQSGRQAYAEEHRRTSSIHAVSADERLWAILAREQTLEETMNQRPLDLKKFLRTNKLAREILSQTEIDRFIEGTNREMAKQYIRHVEKSDTPLTVDWIAKEWLRICEDVKKRTNNPTMSHEQFLKELTPMEEVIYELQRYQIYGTSTGYPNKPAPTLNLNPSVHHTVQSDERLRPMARPAAPPPMSEITAIADALAGSRMETPPIRTQPTAPVRTSDSKPEMSEEERKKKEAKRKLEEEMTRKHWEMTQARNRVRESGNTPE